MSRSPLVGKYSVPMAVIRDEDSESAIRIIQTSWKNVYSVIYEDAYQSKECGHKFMTSEDIEKEFQLVIERVIG